MNTVTKLEQENLINVYPEEFDFFKIFFQKKNIHWKEEEKRSNIIMLNKSLTGYIRTPIRKIILKPKYKEVSITHVLRLYNYVFSYDGIQDDNLLDINISSQSMNVVQSFLRKLNENIQIGILQEYFATHQNLEYLKGKVNFVPTYKNIMMLKEKPVVTEVYSLSPNTLVNRLIKGALLIIGKSVSDNGFEALELLSYFNNVTPVDSNASDYLSEIHFNSKNIRYKKVALEAAMIIDSLYYDDVGGNVGGESFLINFDLLFEKFVQKILLQKTNQRDFSVWIEDKKLGEEYLDGLVLREKKYSPDITYKLNQEDIEKDFHPSAVAVLDVKNKANNVFSNQDIYQIMLYNQILYANKSILIYPSFFYKKPTIFSINNSNIAVPEVSSCFVDIVTPTAEGFKKSIKDFVEDIYEILRENL